MAKRQQEDLPQLNLYKTIFQARYKPHLRFYTLLFPATEKFSEYPHWETDRLSVTLRDPGKRYSLTILHNSFAYDQDSDKISDEERNIKKVLADLPEALEIATYTRLGFRRKYLIPVSMSFDQLVSILNVKLLSQDERLTRIMPKKTEDMIYRVISSEGLLGFTITIGPMTKYEISGHVAFNKKDHLDPETADVEYQEIVQAYPEVAVFLDIDIYRIEEGIPKTDAMPFVQEARERVTNIATNLRDYLFSVDVED